MNTVQNYHVNSMPALRGADAERGYCFVTEFSGQPLPPTDDRTSRHASKMSRPVPSELEAIRDHYLSATRLPADALVSLTYSPAGYIALINPVIVSSACQIGRTWITGGLVSDSFNLYQLNNREDLPW